MKDQSHSWFRERNYLHFDSPISKKKAERIVKDSNRIAAHSFFPFIDYEIKSYKVYLNEHKQVKKKYKTRPIAYAGHLDSHIYAYYAQIISQQYEEKIDQLSLQNNILAFRSLGKSNIHFANDAFENIRARKKCSVIALDIRKFFDRLDHKVLKRAWCDLLDVNKLPQDHFNLFKSLTRYSKVNRTSLYETLGLPKTGLSKDRYRLCDSVDFRKLVRGNRLIETHDKPYGIPQGSPISALLSNIYMLDFDIWANKTMREQNGSYYRYCDDILFITSEEHRDDIEDLAQKAIVSLGLEINTDKTEKHDFWISGGVQKCDKALQYLGFTFDGERKLLRSAALARFSNRMKSGVRLAKATQRKGNRIKITRGIPTSKLYKRKLYERYSYLSKGNFITYSHRAAKIMESDAIRKQVKPLWRRLNNEIDK